MSGGTRNAGQRCLAVAEHVLLKNYRQQPVVMERGLGTELWDVDGNRYLDMMAGISVCSLGHCHPALSRAVAEQAGRLMHTSNLYHVERQIAAAEAITERSGADRVYFCNSGAEANEAALKLARRYQAVVANKPERIKVVSTDGSFHGRSVATVSVTGQAKYREGFGPLFGPVEFVPFGDLAAADAAMSTEDACAFIVEPIQAEGGIIVAPDGYLAGLRKLADRTGTVLIFDEVQTGIGRTGKWFACQHEGVQPDVITMAKALGGGVPVGAIAVHQKVAEGLSYQEGGAVPHASTFGGNPLACAAVVAVLDTIDAEGLLENCVQAGQYLSRRLGELTQLFPSLCVEHRGRGLLRGLVLDRPASAIVGECRDRGLLLTVAGGNVIRFSPALIVRRAHIDEAVGVLEHVLSKHAKG